MKINIIFTGVGGHGIITASSLLGRAAVKAGINVVVSELHGMAQRGGVVTCTIRIGDVHSPLISDGTADTVISTEPAEALRQIEKTNKDTVVITDINPVIPSTVSIENQIYPDVDKILDELRRKTKLIDIDALDISKKAGGTLSRNIVMLGALSATDIVPFSQDMLLKTILDYLPSRYREINERAFEFGRKAVLKILKKR